MERLTRAGILACSLLLAAFAAVVVLQIVSGRISLAGLLQTKERDGGRTFSPARLQALLVTVVVAARYLYLVLAHPGLESLPSLPASVVAVLGGSHAAYLGGKAYTAYIEPLLKNLK